MNDRPPLPLSTYVHIPWCARKCPYCDFNSHPHNNAGLPEEAYIRALTSDLERDQPLLAGREIQTLFFGGGTPSLFSAKAIGDILELLHSRVGLSADCEITLEANPGSAEAGRFKGYRSAGVNRLSIGVQSFDDLKLQALGRIHAGDEARQAFSFARGAGFDNINIDLMHGLPNQSVEDAQRDLEAAFSLGPEHLSWYELTIEPNTEFYKRRPMLPDENRLERIQDLGFTLLEQAGYRRYETSAYAKPGRECRHNRNYWEFGDYLGLGAGAHGKLTAASGGDILRASKTRMPVDYMRQDTHCRQLQQIDPSDQAFEYLMNGLRLIDGFAETQFVERTQLSLADIDPLLLHLQRRGFIERKDGWVKPTPQGVQFLNTCLVEVMEFTESRLVSHCDTNFG